MATHRRQAGTTSVEFAIAGVALFVLLFGVVEVGRMMFARTMLEEGVRRAARLATVCPLNDPAIARAGMFDSGSGGPLLSDLTAGNFNLNYLDASGTVIGNPGVAFSQIRFVRVGVQNYSFPLLIPFVNLSFVANGISSTLPAESLGVTTTAVVAC
ncbi:MAG: TadE family protein [Steroidobacteraceae bacterium]